MTMYHSSAGLRQCLKNASSEERQQLSKIADEYSDKSLSGEDLQKEVCSAAGHTFGNMIRGEGVSYLELLEDACAAWKIEKVPSRYDEVDGQDFEHLDSSIYKLSMPKDKRHDLVEQHVCILEDILVSKVAITLYEKMTPEQRSQIDQQISAQASKIADKSLTGTAATAAAYAAAKAGGFGTYMLMSSVLKTASMGSLGFGAYTLASQGLKLLLGPAGLVAMGALAIINLGSPDKQKVAMMGLSCAMISMRLRNERLELMAA